MKTFGILVAVSTALTMVACNKGGGVGESSKPAATTAAVGLNNGGSVAPPPPVRNQPPRNSQVGDDRILSDDTTLHEDRDPVLPSRPQTSERRREQATPVVDVPPSQRSLQCGEAFRESSPEWFPGLPNPPSQEPIFTDLAGKSGLRYTDARQDGLFALAVERANALPAQMQKANQEFAKQIRDVKISVDLNKTRMVKVQVVYQHRMRKAAIELRGQLERATEVRLVQVPVPGQAINDQSFGGVLTCADSDHGCKNILLRLDLKARDSQKILRTVYVVHRWGDAHITMSENERRSFARLPNQNQSAFAEYLSNTVNNTCLNVLADATAGRRQLPACALQRLQANCGGEDVKRPSAQAFGLRSWSAAYGRSAFELVLASNGSYDGVADYDSKRTQYMTVRGPLAYAVVEKGAPVYKHPLAVSGNLRGISEVYLMNNDGGGNLNLQIDFLGSESTHSRLSVSSLLPNTQYAKTVVETAQQMPQVANQDVVDQQDSVREEPIEEPQDLK